MNIYATYFCNFRCPFCFLTNEQRGDATVIDLDWVSDQLSILKSTDRGLETGLTILGGEPSILPQSFQRKIVDICTNCINKKPWWITNLSVIPVCVDDVDLIVSYDFNVRQDRGKVVQNILNLNCEFSLSTVLTKPIVDQVGPRKFLDFINHFQLCKRADIHILTQTPTTPSYLIPTDDSLISFLDVVLDDRKVNLANYSNFNNVINLGFDNFSDRIALLPNNKYGVTSLDLGQPYQVADTLDQALHAYYANVETLSVSDVCQGCQFLGSCSSRVFSNYCTGHKRVMEFLKNRSVKCSGS